MFDTSLPELSSLVVVHNFYIVRTICFPSETDTPLIVDPYAVLPLAVSLQQLQTVASRYAQVIQTNRGFHLIQLSQSH